MTKIFGQTILAAALVTGISAAAVSSAYAQTEQRSARTAQARAVALCEGFAQEYINTRTQNASTSTTSTAFVEMANTRIPGGASGDIDLYTVTLSGQASASGGGSWEARAEVSISGGPFVAMNPNEPVTFHSGNLAQTHTMTWCREISGSPTFRIVWRKVGDGAAVFDDYLMRVERSN